MTTTVLSSARQPNLFKLILTTFFMYGLYTLYGIYDYILHMGKHKNTRVVVTIFIANAGNATIQRGEPHHGGIVLLLHHRASGLILTNETKATLVGVPRRLVRTEIRVALLSFSYMYKYNIVTVGICVFFL